MLTVQTSWLEGKYDWTAVKSQLVSALGQTMIRRHNNSTGFSLLLARRRLGRPLDLRCVPARHCRIAQLLRERLPLLQHLDCASYIAFTQKVAGSPENLRVALSFFSRVHDF